jgi:hypothetical protein
VNLQFFTEILTLNVRQKKFYGAKFKSDVKLFQFKFLRNVKKYSEGRVTIGKDILTQV